MVHFVLEIDCRGDAFNDGSDEPSRAEIARMLRGAADVIANNGTFESWIRLADSNGNYCGGFKVQK
jgi:hypothetical protein